MSTLAAILLVSAGCFAFIDWWSVATDRPGVEYLAKPLVIVALVGLALALDASDDTARGLVVAALGASLVGDVVLLSPDGPFEGGLGAFLTAHVLYIIALADSFRVEPAIAGAILIVAIMIGVLPQLLAAVRTRGPTLTVAVTVYVVALSTMALFATATGVVVAAVGGLAFLVSDALLGWGRFVGPAPGGRTLVHVTYHVGQTGLVLWLAA